VNKTWILLIKIELPIALVEDWEGELQKSRAEKWT
jgi:hypothetical protein